MFKKTRKKQVPRAKSTGEELQPEKVTMNRDRSQSVQQLNLSRHVSSQLSYPGTSNTKSCSGAVGGSSVKADTGNVTVKIQKTRFHSESEVELPNVSKAGARATRIFKMEHNDHVKKVAICYFQNTLLYQLDQNRPLAGIVEDICDKWNLQNTVDYALQFSEASRQTYITERNRADIQNGNVLQLTESPGQSAQTIMDRLNRGSREEKVDALKNLSLKCTDQTFAHEFINRDGLKLVISYVISGSKSFSGDPLMYLLRSFVALMEHNLVSWDILEPDFTKQVTSCISGARSAGEGCTQPALEILENVILHSTDKAKMETLDQHITADKIIPYLRSHSKDVQQCALAVINAMFMKSSQDKKQKLMACFHSKTFRNDITEYILPGEVSQDMAHELYKHQRLMLNMYEERLKTPVNTSNNAQVTQVNKTVEELRRTAFDFSDIADPNTGPSRKSGIAKDLKKLGFTDQSDPVKDFETAPPGLLALDNMIHFAQCHKETYIKVVLENCGRANEQDCPFVQASLKLTNILCDLLKVGEQPYEDETCYYPMFFSVDKPLEEFFSVCIHLCNRTWKEMRASREDFEKVLSVVREQITRALDKNQMPKSFDAFKSKLVVLAYPELKKIWDAERQRREESKAQAKPILELREMIKPEILELVRKHRLTYLEEGTRFHKYDNKGSRVKNKYQYWRLSANHKAFFYGDCEDKDTPALEQLPNKLAIHEIMEMVTGKNCAHVKQARNKLDSNIAFSLVLEGSRPDEEKCFHFSANSEQEYMLWEDGINALLNNPMTSRQTKEDMDILLNMEIKLRLLETEGITIPKEPPPIPPLPDNYNFAYTQA